CINAGIQRTLVPGPFHLARGDLREMRAIGFEIAEEMTAIAHRHVDIDEGIPVRPFLPEITAALNRILENRGGHLNFRIDALCKVVSLAHKAVDLIDAVLIKEVAHVGRSTGDGAAIE